MQYKLRSPELLPHQDAGVLVHALRAQEAGLATAAARHHDVHKLRASRASRHALSRRGEGALRAQAGRLAGWLACRQAGRRVGSAGCHSSAGACMAASLTCSVELWLIAPSTPNTAPLIRATLRSKRAARICRVVSMAVQSVKDKAWVPRIGPLHKMQAGCKASPTCCRGERVLACRQQTPECRNPAAAEGRIMHACMQQQLAWSWLALMPSAMKKAPPLVATPPDTLLRTTCRCSGGGVQGAAEGRVCDRNARAGVWRDVCVGWSCNVKCRAYELDGRRWRHPFHASIRCFGSWPMSHGCASNSAPKNACILPCTICHYIGTKLVTN